MMIVLLDFRLKQEQGEECWEKVFWINDRESKIKNVGFINNLVGV
jgi:hypothetical protein